MEVIIQATDRAMGLHITDKFKPCEDCALVKTKKSRVSKKRAMACSKIVGERLFFDISSPLTPNFGGRKH